MRYYIILAYIFIVFNSISAQQEILSEIRYKFETFQYEDVVRLSDQIIATYRDLSPDTLLSVYTMKAVSHYNLNQDELSRRSFIELLKIKKDYNLDPIIISPKIITFFESVRTDYNRILDTKNDVNNQTRDSIQTNLNTISSSSFSNYQSSILQSFLLPGLGHLTSNRPVEGWVLTSLSAINIGSLIYFVFDTNKKEDQYLSEPDPLFVQEKYNQYNSSYKIRNVLIASYIIIWTYSQLDMLLFYNADENKSNFMPELNAEMLPDKSVKYNFSLKVLF
ncbi:MAG: hypothetical protein V1720_16955 [bacterium]